MSLNDQTKGTLNQGIHPVKKRARHTGKVLIPISKFRNVKFGEKKVSRFLVRGSFPQGPLRETLGRSKGAVALLAWYGVVCSRVRSQA